MQFMYRSLHYRSLELVVVKFCFLPSVQILREYQKFL